MKENKSIFNTNFRKFPNREITLKLTAHNLIFGK